MENKDISIYRAVYQTLSDNGFTLADEYYKYSLEKGGYIILLDGFDEVNRDKLKKSSRGDKKVLAINLRKTHILYLRVPQKCLLDGMILLKRLLCLFRKNKH